MTTNPPTLEAWRKAARDRQEAGDLAGAADEIARALHLCQPQKRQILLADAALIELARRQPDAAEEFARRALSLDAASVPALRALAGCYRQRGNLDKAERIVRQGLSIHPQDPRLLMELGLVVSDRGQESKAANLFAAALKTRTAEPEAFANLAVELQRIGQADLAGRFYRAALERGARGADLWANLAAAEFDLGHMEKAEYFARKALRINKNTLSAAQTLGMALLSRGNDGPITLTKGFYFQSARWANKSALHRPNPALHRLAEPTPADCRTVIVWPELGLGDQLSAAAVLVVEQPYLPPQIRCAIDSRLHPLLRRTYPSIDWVDSTIPDEALCAGGDAELPLLSLPGRQWRRQEALTPAIAWLHPDPAAVARWREWLAAERQRRGLPTDAPAIGLSWRSGNPRTGGHKGTALADWLAALSATPPTGPTLTGMPYLLVNLQYGDLPEGGGKDEPLAGQALAQAPLDLRTDLDGLAALMTALDGVVGIPGFALHLAGALGRPGLVAIPPSALWVWRLGAPGLTWYPTLRPYPVAPGVVPAQAVADWAANLPSASIRQQ